MMSAREYANKYPGQAVKLASKFAKEIGIDDDGKPIGIVVGYKPGTKGVIGSSKVAVYRGNIQARYGLEAKTKSTFHPVVPNPPDHRLGIYFLSVNCVELVRKLKDVPCYPHTCGVCKSPARKGANLIVCSNPECKTKKGLLNSIGPIPKFYSVNKDKFVLCPTCQIKDGVKNTEHEFLQTSSYASQQHKNLVCRRCNSRFSHSWKDGHKLNYQGTHEYIWQNGQLIHNVPKKKLAFK